MSGDILQSAILSRLYFATILEIMHSYIIVCFYLLGQGLNLVLLL